MRLNNLLSNRKRLRDIPFLIVLPDRAIAGGESVDLKLFQEEYADEIEQANRSEKIWGIDASNPKGPKPDEL